MTTHFTREELTRSSFADRNGILNIPNKAQEDNLLRLAISLEYIRSINSDNPVYVTSGFRNSIVNKGVFGSPTSAHLEGLAADIIPSGTRTLRDFAKIIIDSSLSFDQLIIYKNFIHFGLSSNNRRQVIYKDN